MVECLAERKEGLKGDGMVDSKVYQTAGRLAYLMALSASSRAVLKAVY